MATVYLVPAGTETAPGASPGDYLLRPDGQRYEVGVLGGASTWVGTLDASLLPELPAVDAPAAAPHQEAVLVAVRGLESAEVNRGG